MRARVNLPTPSSRHGRRGNDLGERPPRIHCLPATPQPPSNSILGFGPVTCLGQRDAVSAEARRQVPGSALDARHPRRNAPWPPCWGVREARGGRANASRPDRARPARLRSTRQLSLDAGAGPAEVSRPGPEWRDHTTNRNEGKEKCISETSARCPNPMNQCQKLPFRDKKMSLCQTRWPGFPLPAVKAPPPAAWWLMGPPQVPGVCERLTSALRAGGGCLVVPFRIWSKARVVLSPDVGQMFRFRFLSTVFY